MFFIAFFGVQDKDKYIGTCNNTECPSCGRLSRFDVYKSYRYFHVFFVPTFRWNVKYIVKTSCCGCLYELDPFVGKEVEKNPGMEIRNEHLRRVNSCLPFKYCSYCNTNVPAEFSYCPYCGTRL